MKQKHCLDRLSSCGQGAWVGGGDVPVHGVHPSRGQTHSCRFKEIAACRQNADMVSFFLNFFKVDSTSHAGSDGRLHQMHIPRAQLEKTTLGIQMFKKSANKLDSI